VAHFVILARRREGGELGMVWEASETAFCETCGGE
jgi:hypothetical protein